jgi:uncharacterized membrane protein YhaH (DUF805 family)
MDPNEVIAVFRHNITQHYFDLAGRVSRKEFWYFALACFVVFIAAAIVDGVVGTNLLRPLVGLALLLPMAGMGARRLQDTGRNGQMVWIWVGLSALLQVIALLAALTVPFGSLGLWMFYGSIAGLLALAALAIAVVLIYFWIQPGIAGENQYGPQPPEMSTTTPA